MADEMMVGQWPMPAEGRTHDPSEHVVVRIDDLKSVVDWVAAAVAYDEYHDEEPWPEFDRVRALVTEPERKP